MTETDYLVARMERAEAIVKRMTDDLRRIANLVDAPHWNTERKYRIRDIALAAVAAAEEPT